LTAKDGKECSIASLIAEPLELILSFKQSGWCDSQSSELLAQCNEGGVFHSLLSPLEVVVVKDWIKEGAPTE